MQLEFDVDFFALAVTIKLQQDELSYAAAVAKWPWLNKPMLSRAVNKQKLSAASVLSLCRAFAMDPDTFLVAKRPGVSALASRGTGPRGTGQ